MFGKKRDEWEGAYKADSPQRKGGCLRNVFALLMLLLLLAAGLLVGSNLWVAGSTHHSIYTEVEEVPEEETGLVLGTSKSFVGGRENLHFKNRMAAAAALFQAGKVERLLVSGAKDGGYNEAHDMRDRLVQLGVPTEKITLDEAGFRTLDSVVRAKEVFGLERALIISDDFHVPRAVFLAENRGLEAVGFASEAVPSELSAKTRFREKLARVKAVLDLFVLGTEPVSLQDSG